MRDNLLAADQYADEQAEYAYIREQEAAREARATDAVSMWHESANLKPIQYTTFINR